MVRKQKIKKTAKRTARVHEMIDAKTEHLLPPSVISPKRPRRLNRLAVALIALGLVAIAVSQKGLFVAAVVDGRPIFRWQLTRLLTDRFGQQTLDSMISETLIHAEARKAGVVVSDEDIAAKQADLVKSLGDNVSIEDILQYQGMTKADFENQLRLQLTVEALLGKDITVSEEDIDQYIGVNQETMMATDESTLRQEARQALFSQEINDKVQIWFEEVRSKAKVLKFL